MLALILGCLLSVAHTANWAVLVAGSNEFYNYRHQADVLHAYKALTNKGFDPSNIIVLAYDDIASSPSNPFPGKVFNKPSYQNPGVDVYAGVKIDYKGANVTPQIFLNVLLGNKSAVAGHGSGRVLESTRSDNVFIFFSDHGAAGLIAFPSEELYADQLTSTLKQLAATGKFNQLVFYLEACESGSMFQKLPKNISIYALSASSPTESSWATYCSPDDVVGGKHIGSCLGDLFSINFLEDLDASDLSTETFEDQFHKVFKLTNLSKVMQWGDLTFTNESVSAVIGPKPSSRNFVGFRREIHQESPALFKSLPMHSIKINYLAAKYARDPSDHNLHELREEMYYMQKMDNLFYHIRKSQGLRGEADHANIQFECLRAAKGAVDKQCGRMKEYALQYVKLLAEHCETSSFESLLPIIQQHC